MNEALNPAVRTAHPLFFMHLPKTAGTSVFHLLKGYLGDRVFSAGPLRMSHGLTGSELMDYVWTHSDELFAGRSAFVFHGTPRFIAKMPPGTKTMIMLRDPVERLVSAFKYRRRVKAKKNDLGEYGKNLQTFSRFVMRGNDTENIYLDRLAEGSGDLDVALERLAEFDVVGITERFAESIELLCELQGWILPPTLPRARQAPERDDVLGTLDDEAAERLDEITRADRAIYEAALRIHEEQHRSMTRRLVDGRARSTTAVNTFRGLTIDPSADLPWHGWHAPTPNGRWSGPATVSAIDVPLRPGNYIVKVDIGRAINASVRSQTTVAFNGRTLPLVRTESGEAEARIHESDFKSSGPISRLRFEVPQVGQPADANESGPIRGLLLRGVVFEPTGRSLTASGPTPMSTEKPPYVVRTPGSRAPQRTVVVVGSPRGGTSMVAGALRELGVYLGPRLGHNHEDPSFLSRDVDQIRGTVAERNASHDVWGWKVPHSIEYLPEILGDLRNPHFVTVVRNPVAVAMSNHYHSGMDVDQSLRTAMGYYNQIVDFVAATDAPLMLIDYERALREQRPFVDGLVEFLGLDVAPADRDRAVRFIDPSTGYRQISSHDYELKPVAPPEGGRELDVKVSYDNVEELGNGEFRALTADPIVIISSDEGLPTAFYLGFEFASAEPSERAKFYFDFEGEGFSENMSLTTDLTPGPHWFRVETGGSLRRLRYDPIDHAGEFTLRSVTLTDELATTQ